MFRLARPALALLLLCACDSEPAPSDAGVDAAPIEEDAGPDAAAECAARGLAYHAFDPTADGARFQQVAGDFTVQTLDGPWNLAESWSGCDSYVFLAWSGTAYGQALFETYPDELLTHGPANVHYFFGSHATDPAAAEAEAMRMRGLVEDAFVFQGVSAEDAERWRSRVHYVTQPLAQSSGSVGLLSLNVGAINVFAITRQQRFDPVGSLSVFTSRGATPRMEMARFAAPYYDYLAALDERLADVGSVTVVPLLEEETTTLRTIDRTVTLPDAATVAAFDTLEVDLEVTCHLAPDGCSEWDRIGFISVCEDPSCTTTLELVRWITPYSRPGRRRWAMDASPLLGLLASGGERTFRMTFGPDWEEATERVVSVSLRFSNAGAADRAAGAELAFRGGTFGADYNTDRLPFTFTPPPGTRRVELVTIVSGHGQEAGNCAEWCNHVHTFQANGGAERVVSFEGEAGQPLGCAERAGEGVPPGQWGNWAPLRAGWCPGFPVAARRFDVTDDVNLGGENTLTYRGNYAGGEPQGGSIQMSTYVAYFR